MNDEHREGTHESGWSSRTAGASTATAEPVDRRWFEEALRAQGFLVEPPASTPNRRGRTPWTHGPQCCTGVLEDGPLAAEVEDALAVDPVAAPRRRTHRRARRSPRRRPSLRVRRPRPRPSHLRRPWDCPRGRRHGARPTPSDRADTVARQSDTHQPTAGTRRRRSRPRAAGCVLDRSGGGAAPRLLRTCRPCRQPPSAARLSRPSPRTRHGRRTRRRPLHRLGAGPAGSCRDVGHDRDPGRLTLPALQPDAAADRAGRADAIGRPVGRCQPAPSGRRTAPPLARRPPAPSGPAAELEPASLRAADVARPSPMPPSAELAAAPSRQRHARQPRRCRRRAPTAVADVAERHADAVDAERRPQTQWPSPTGRDRGRAGRRRPITDAAVLEAAAAASTIGSAGRGGRAAAAEATPPPSPAALAATGRRDRRARCQPAAPFSPPTAGIAAIARRRPRRRSGHDRRRRRERPVGPRGRSRQGLPARGAAPAARSSLPDDGAPDRLRGHRRGGPGARLPLPVHVAPVVTLAETGTCS